MGQEGIAFSQLQLEQLEHSLQASLDLSPGLDGGTPLLAGALGSTGGATAERLPPSSLGLPEWQAQERLACRKVHG